MAKHPRIIQLVAAVEAAPQLICELLPLGALSTYVQLHTVEITVAQQLEWILQVAQGMNYLESIRVVHRNLAAR